MTSEHTKGNTEAFFQKHDYFGLNPKDVCLFEQHMLPCLTFKGKIILEKKYKVARAPSKQFRSYCEYRAKFTASILRL